MNTFTKKKALCALVGLALLLLVFSCACADGFSLPSAVKSIESMAFYEGVHADMLEIPEGCVYIGSKAFAHCDISCVVLPRSLKTIESDAFEGITDLDVIAPAGSYACQWAVSKGWHVCDNPIEDFEFSDNGDGSCTLTKYNGSDDVVVVPDHDLDGRPVTAIGDRAFYYAINKLVDLNREGNVPIRLVYLPSTVTDIGSYAFYGRYRISGIRLPKGLQTIGDYAFYMGGFESIDLPDSLKRIGNSAFIYSNLTSVNLPEGVQIEEKAFCGTHLTSVRIPAGIDSIGDRAFYSCSELKELTFDEGVSSIGDEAFSMTSIESLSLPASLRYIGEGAFKHCYQLGDVALANGLTSIGNGAFSGARISAITIPESVSQIGSGAFSNCRQLKDVVLNCANLGGISDCLFLGCSSLEDISLPEGVARIGYAAFSACVNLQSIDIPDSVLSIGNFAFSCDYATRFGDEPGDEVFYCASLSRLEQIRLPQNLTEIGEGAFQHCDALRVIDLPPTLLSIGEGAFSACNRLEKLVIPGRIGCLGNVFKGVNRDKLGMHSNNHADSLKEIVITDGVTAIADGAFKGMDALEKVTIPSSVTQIGETAFEGCDALTAFCERDSHAAYFCSEHGIPCVLSGDPTLDESLSESIESVISAYTDDDGFLPNDASTLESAALAVFDYANELMAQGVISNCTYCDVGHSVAFYDQQGRVYLYLPAIRETYSGSKDYSAIGISGFSLLDSTVIDAVDRFSRFNITGALEAAEYIHTNAGEYTQDVPLSGNNATVGNIVTWLGSTSPGRTPQGRVVFWRGHGGLWTDGDTLRTALAVNEKRDGEKYADYRDSHAVVISDGHYYVTDLFFESVLPETDGGLFVCGSCYGVSDGGRLAKAILNKGFSAFVGTTGSVWGPYSEKYTGQLAVHLLEKDENDLYITIEEAMNRTENDLGANDIYGTSFVLVNRAGAQPFRLAAPTRALSDYPVLQYNGHSYQYVGQAATFADAEAICEAVGGHLCTINTEEENDALTRYLARNGIDAAMIGLYDAKGSNGTWDTWVTGEPVTFSNWAPYQPDWEGQTICVLGTSYGYYGTYDYGMWDNNWDGNISYLCEWENALESDDTTNISSLSVTRAEDVAGAPFTATFTTDGDIQGVRITMLRASGEPVDLGEYTMRNGGASRSEKNGGYSWTVSFVPTEDGLPADNYMVRFRLEGIDLKGINTKRYATSGSIQLSNAMFHYDGHTYQYINTAKTWNAAKAWCQSKGGHLLTINSEAEQNAITSWLMPNFEFGRVWLGLNRADFSTWITGEPVTYSNWGATQPDNDWHTAQNCVAMANYHQSGKVEPGQWDDWGQEDVELEKFVCEWDYSTEIMFTYANPSDSEGVFGKAGLDFSYSCLYGNDEKEGALNDVLRSYGYNAVSLAEIEKLIVFVDGYGKEFTFEGTTVSKQTALCAVLWHGKVVYATTQASTLPDWPFSSYGNYDENYVCSDVNTLPDGVYDNVTHTKHNQAYPALKLGGVDGVMAIRVHSSSKERYHEKNDCPLVYADGCQAGAKLNKGINIHKTSYIKNGSETVKPGSAGCLNIHANEYDAFAAAVGFANINVNSGIAKADTSYGASTVDCYPVVIVSRKYGYDHNDAFRQYVNLKYTAPDESAPRINLINAILDGDSSYKGNG